ncbi:MAG: sensor histidine kinase, partial [Bacteroidia bacterium]|nr:sensor histidine kinase [Bacteroidia bacterium]
SHALKKQISITTHIEMHDVNVNVDKMWRVFSNILANAIKFSNKNSVITISTHANDKKVLIVFKDEGIGIPLEKQKDIFNTYAMKGQQGTSGEVSYGMGMFICKQIVEAHGGKIWFDSIENKGTTFYVELDRVVE